LAFKTRILQVLAVGGALAGAACSPTGFSPAGFDFAETFTGASSVSAYAPTPASRSAARPVDSRERNCLMRAMYFESIRSSDDGMFAVGTVVMNRVESPRFPDTVCGVVGQPNQFASGVMSRTMTEAHSKSRARAVADRVLGGERHSGVRTAKFFHQAGLRFPYNNMSYVLEAGGNEFYIKG